MRRGCLRKLISSLFSLLVIAGIACAIYFNQKFVKTHIIDRVKGMYYVHQGDKAYRNMQSYKAVKFYNKGLKLFPGHYSAWYNLGNIYVSFEDYYSALYSYAQAFKYNPKMMIARMNYGIVATQKLGNFDIAIEQFNKIVNTKRKLLFIPYVFNNKISTKENKAIAYYNIGVAYRLKSLYEIDDWEKQRKYLAQAIEAYKKSLEIDPKRYDTLYNLGIAYHLSGRYNDAGINYCKAVEVQPMSYEAHYNLAVLLRRLRYYEQAYEEIEKAAALVTALNENSAQQQYVAIVMNDILRTMYGDDQFRSKLNTIIEEEKKKSLEHISDNEIKSKQTPKDKKNGTITSEGVNLVNGKVVVTKELDASILKNFGKCSVMKLFTHYD